MKRLSLYILTLFALLSCEDSQSSFRLKGEFKHLEQGEFYLYTDRDIAKFDTLKITNGRFTYEANIDYDVTYHLLYPNFSELTFFASPGDKIKIKGDARHLIGTEVTGSKDNEEYTAFRLGNQEKNEKEQQAAAADFIKQHPTSQVSIYLFKQHFLLAQQRKPEIIKDLYRELLTAQPQNAILNGWKDQITYFSELLEVNDSLPNFSFSLEDSTNVKRKDYEGKYLLVNFWASWDGNTTSMFYRIRKFWEQYPDKFEILSISLDVEKKNKKNVERNCSIKWPSYSDYMAWNSPLVRDFRITSVPCFFFVGPDLKIIAIGEDFTTDIQPVIKKTLNLK